MFSILIPTWNNLPYLQLCIDSIRRHSAYDHEILVHVNEGSDGTLEWVRSQGLRHTWSKGNIGVCLALNQLSRLATRDWVLFLNDDMFCTPGWDAGLLAASRAAEPVSYLSSQMIEPNVTRSTQVKFADFGTDPETFNESGLLEFCANLVTPDVDGVASQPALVSRELWHTVGGYSIEFSPGMSSDDDFLMKLWLVGCRTFRTIGTSLVYHFACRSTGRIRRNHGSHEFLMKWGITQSEFKDRHLSRTGAETPADLPNVPRPGLGSRLKRLVYSLESNPWGDLRAWDNDLPSHMALSKESPPDGTR